MLPELSEKEVLRYSRHLKIPDIGLEGQRRIKGTSALLIGAGGLGSAISIYLAATGVGRIGIVDHDVVELSNLQRQVVHSSNRLGKSKADSARERMLDINPNIQVEAYNVRFTAQNAEHIAEEYDIFVDGTDNLETRYLINDLAVLTGKPYVYGSVFRFEGHVSVFDASRGPCYRCLFPEPPPPDSLPSTAETGLFSILPGTIGTIQATEVIKLISGFGSPLIGKLLLYDAAEMSVQIIKFRKDPACKICGSKPEITDLTSHGMI